MLAQKIVDGVFESIKPYINLRRFVVYVVIILSASDSGIALLFLNYSELSLKSGATIIMNAVYNSRFLVAFPSMFICFLIAPHLNSWMANKAVKINNNLLFIDDVFSKAEGDRFLDVEILSKRKHDFIVVSRRFSASLETLLSFFICVGGVVFIDFLNFFVYYALISLIAIPLFYIEATSYIVRKYASSVYLIRLNDEIKKS